MDATTISIGFVTGAVTFVIGYLTFMRNRDKDTRSDAHREAKLETKIDMIVSGVSDIRVELKDSNKRIAELSEYQIRADERLKQVTERVERIEEKIEI